MRLKTWEKGEKLGRKIRIKRVLKHCRPLLTGRAGYATAMRQLEFHHALLPYQKHLVIHLGLKCPPPPAS